MCVCVCVYYKLLQNTYIKYLMRTQYIVSFSVLNTAHR